MNKEFESHKEAYLSEARVHVEAMNNGLLKLEKNPQDMKCFHDIFRATHTLKSMSAAMNYTKTAKLCHTMENMLDAARNKKILIEACFDILFYCFDRLSESLKLIANNEPEPDTDECLNNIQLILQNKSSKGIELKLKESSETLAQFEKPAATQLEKVKYVEVKVEKLDELLNLVEEMVVNKMKLESIRDGLNIPELSATVETIARTINDLQYNVMKVRLVSIGFIFNQFPRMIRDLAKKQHKEVNLIIKGSEIELDRSVVDEISESLVHLLRNAIDHGMETKEEKIRKSKNPVGEIHLTASRTKESVIIEVQDDGNGIDREALIKKARLAGVLKKQTGEDDLMLAVFSGVSTCHEVTDVSGRGLGLNIVKQKIESINGTIQVKSILGVGTTFTIEIPLTLAVIKTLFVSVANKIYAIPLMSIERLFLASNEYLKKMLNYEAMVLDGKNIPIIRLDKLFKGVNKPLATQPIVIVRKDDELIGLAVSELLTTQEIVIKPLNRVLKENKYFLGSAIIGSGEIVLILDIHHLFLSRKTSSYIN